MPAKYIAIVQMKSSEDKEQNLRVSINLINEAASRGASLICFPEFQMAISPYHQSAEKLSSIAEALDGNFLFRIRGVAKKNRIMVIATVYEKSQLRHRVYDTAVAIDPFGRITSAYRKLHLYDALGFKESSKMTPGRTIEEPFKSRAGKIGLMICYDIRFPEISRILAINGADILAAPSAWVYGRMKVEHWQTMLKARAIENGAYVVAPDQVGNIYLGRSMVIDPFGTVLLDMRNRKGLEIVEINRSKIREVRESLPLLKNRREDVYELKSKFDSQKR